MDFVATRARFENAQNPENRNPVQPPQFTNRVAPGPTTPSYSMNVVGMYLLLQMTNPKHFKHLQE